MQVTCTVGGVISGYCATGSNITAMLPASVIMTEITAAKIGRAMKNVAMGRYSSTERHSVVRCGIIVKRVRGLSSLQFCLTPTSLPPFARANTLQSFDDHLFASFQAAGNDSHVAALGTQFDGSPRGNAVARRRHKQISRLGRSPKPARESNSRLIRLAGRNSHSHKQAAGQGAIFVFEHAPDSRRARAGADFAFDKI